MTGAPAFAGTVLRIAAVYNLAFGAFAYHHLKPMRQTPVVSYTTRVNTVLGLSA